MNQKLVSQVSVHYVTGLLANLLDKADQKSEVKEVTTSPNAQALCIIGCTV